MQRAAVVSEEEASDAEQGHGDFADMDEPKNLRAVALRALARASHECHIKALPLHETE